MESKSAFGLMFLTIILILTILLFGCTFSVGNPGKVRVEAIYEADHQGSASNPMYIDIHATSTNMGDSDLKNIISFAGVSYSGKILNEEPIYFGTVKAGTPVKKIRE